MGATLEALIAAFCRLDKSLSCCWEKGWLVGAVGIENTTGRNFKDLEGMQGNAKALKRNNWECKGILIDAITTPASTVRVNCFGVHPNSARTEGGRDANYRM
jgi:hypothetical protein